MIYLDANATTPLCQEAKEALFKHLEEGQVNPSSSHSFGQIGKKKLREAREDIAHFMDVHPLEIVFTSGGTESMNLLLRTLLPKGDVITTDLEHPCVHNTLRAIKPKEEITILKVGKEGAPTPSLIEAAITDKTTALVFSAVNSETGALLDLENVALLANKYRLVLIIDGVALLGKKSFSIPDGVSGMGFSSHKIHGPQGVGFCFIKEGAMIYAPFQTGGPQEMERRAGTENLLAILGLSQAIKALKNKDPAYLAHLRDTFEEEVFARIPFAYKNIDGPRISNISNLYFEGIDAESLLILLDQHGVMASYGSACSSGALEPSRVLLGMGYPKKRASSSIRFSFHYQNTEEEIKKAADILYQCCSALAI